MYSRVPRLEEDYINESGINSRTSKRKSLRIVFEPFIFTLLLLFCISIIVGFVYYLVFLLPPVIMNVNVLVSSTIPNELMFYHSLLSEHNETLVQIEKNILTYTNVSSIIINPNTLDLSNRIIRNIDRITTTLNITQIQDNIEDIVNTLNRILPHWIDLKNPKS